MAPLPPGRSARALLRPGPRRLRRRLPPPRGAGGRGGSVEGDFFGEAGLLLGVPRTATVRAGRDGAEVLALDRDGFGELAGPHELTHEEIARVMRRRMAALQALVQSDRDPAS